MRAHARHTRAHTYTLGSWVRDQSRALLSGSCGHVTRLCVFLVRGDTDKNHARPPTPLHATLALSSALGWDRQSDGRHQPHPTPSPLPLAGTNRVTAHTARPIHHVSRVARTIHQIYGMSKMTEGTTNTQCQHDEQDRHRQDQDGIGEPPGSDAAIARAPLLWRPGPLPAEPGSEATRRLFAETGGRVPRRLLCAADSPEQSGARPAVNRGGCA